MYDVLIVGAGLFGATCAERLTRAGKRVLVLERRPHVAGNAYDELVDNQRVSRYGAHIFHTRSADIRNYVQQFAEWIPVTHRKYARIGGRLLAFPISLMTLHQLWGVTTPEEARQALERRRSPQAAPTAHLEAWCLHHIGHELYELFVKGYTEKMWGRPCHELPSTIISRVPVRLSYDDRYFDDPFEAVPRNGYTAMVAWMLSEAEVQCGVDYLADRERYDAMARMTIYTGPIDAYFDYAEGCLDYRALSFQWQRHEEPDVQGALTVNWPALDVPHIRTEEYRHLWPGASAMDGSWICTSTPRGCDDPQDDAMYPVRDTQSMARLQRYQQRAAAAGVRIGGRLGSYQYLNMDQAIGQALKLVRPLCS